VTGAIRPDREGAEKVLVGNGGDAMQDRDCAETLAVAPDLRLQTDPDSAADDLVKLVLALVETVRQLVERQAIRRVENGRLSDEEIERVGLTLMRLEDRMAELKAHFGLRQEDLSLSLGTVQDLADVLGEENGPGRRDR